jgi:hypothetical protein
LYVLLLLTSCTYTLDIEGDNVHSPKCGVTVIDQRSDNGLLYIDFFGVAPYQTEPKIGDAVYAELCSREIIRDAVQKHVDVLVTITDAEAQFVGFSGTGFFRPAEYTANIKGSISLRTGGRALLELPLSDECRLQVIGSIPNVFGKVLASVIKGFSNKAEKAVTTTLLVLEPDDKDLGPSKQLALR